MKTATYLTLAMALALVACSNDPEETAIQQQSAVSDCGGFILESPQMKNPMGNPATYCDAEVLHWSYDAAAGTLSLANNRVLLNCCGNHQMKVADDGGTYVVTETDAPESGDARCDCMCVFDYTLQAEGIPGGTIPMRVVRNVTDDAEGPQVVWTGDIDLTAGSGTITIDTTDVEPWCSVADAI